MKKCTIHHTGIYASADGVIKDDRVYIQEDDGSTYLPEEMFLAREECERGLIQFEAEGKWGFADIYTGEIRIEPVWDYAGPFYRGYAHIAMGVRPDDSSYIKTDGGKHGYIAMNGEIVIPLEYDDAEDIPYLKYFKAARDGKWGLIDIKNKAVIHFQWARLETGYENDLIFCALEKNSELHAGEENKLISDIMETQPMAECGYTLKWGVYSRDFNLVVQPELDEKPVMPRIKRSPRSRSYTYYKKYYILRRGEKYGVLSNDGRWIANVELSKRQASSKINTISAGDFDGKLYI